MNKELRILLTAIRFYTRIPCPEIKDYDPNDLHKATRYFPFIGWLVGGLSFGVYALSTILFDHNIAVVISMLFGVLLTGAFHEDGLADVADGFGGGWTKQKILMIMKDSRVGAFGVISLIFLFLIKYASLVHLLPYSENHLVLFLFFVSYHSLARFTATTLIFTSIYSREDTSSKVKPIGKTYTFREVLGASFFGCLPLVLLSCLHIKAALVLLPLFFISVLAKRYFEKWIDGYTGDCLGAVEQIAECVCILSYIILWKFM